MNKVILGSEGTYGIVTEAIIKIHPEPEHVKFGSIVFPNFEVGILFMKEMSEQAIYPASLRLVDNN